MDYITPALQQYSIYERFLSFEIESSALINLALCNSTLLSLFQPVVVSKINNWEIVDALVKWTKRFLPDSSSIFYAQKGLYLLPHKNSQGIFCLRITSHVNYHSKVIITPYCFLKCKLISTKLIHIHPFFTNNNQPLSFLACFCENVSNRMKQFYILFDLSDIPSVEVIRLKKNYTSYDFSWVHFVYKEFEQFEQIPNCEKLYDITHNKHPLGQKYSIVNKVGGDKVFIQDVNNGVSSILEITSMRRINLPIDHYSPTLILKDRYLCAFEISKSRIVVFDLETVKCIDILTLEFDFKFFKVLAYNLVLLQIGYSEHHYRFMKHNGTTIQVSNMIHNQLFDNNWSRIHFCPSSKKLIVGDMKNSTTILYDYESIDALFSYLHNVER